MPDNPIDKAAVEGALEFGVMPDEMGEEHRDFARGAFASIDTDALAEVVRAVQNVPFVGPKQRRIAEAVKAHLLGDPA